jgi:hypothetical protein
MQKSTRKKEAAEEKGSGIFLWIFLGINVLFAILFIIRFFWG